MVHIFHHTDFDGHAAAHLVKNLSLQMGLAYRLIPVQYNTSLLDELPQIHPDDQVFVVDYSFKENTIDELRGLLERVGKERFCWIDHHASSVELVKAHPELSDIKGVVDASASGAALTYMYLHHCSFEDIPFYLKLISDYDTWTKKLVFSDPFDCGLAMEDWSVESEVWDQLNDIAFVNQIVENGSIISRYKMMNNERRLQRWGFITEFCGYPCLAINIKETSEIFGKHRDEFPVCVIFQTNGKGWFYTVYTDGKSVMASEIAARFGGGGHPGAAGFYTPELLPEFHDHSRWKLFKEYQNE